MDFYRDFDISPMSELTMYMQNNLRRSNRKSPLTNKHPDVLKANENKREILTPKRKLSLNSSDISPNTPFLINYNLRSNPAKFADPFDLENKENIPTLSLSCTTPDKKTKIESKSPNLRQFLMEKIITNDLVMETSNRPYDLRPKKSLTPREENETTCIKTILERKKRQIKFDMANDVSPISSKRSCFDTNSKISFESHRLESAVDLTSNFRDRFLSVPCIPNVQNCEIENEIITECFVNVNDSSNELTLIGDNSRYFILPTIKLSKHSELSGVSPETLRAVLECKFKDYINEVFIIDCRYPYEYEGGHIDKAINLYTKDDIINHFFRTPIKMSHENSNNIIVFHCEFSSQRAPKLAKFLRNRDRMIHSNSYPKLYYPEIYLLQGGYKGFFEKFPEHCIPKSYLKMKDSRYQAELKNFSRKSKSWTEEPQRRTRLNLKN